MPQDTIYLDRDGAIATIHLNRPGKRNALDSGMWARLIDLVDAADADPAVKVIVVTGEGGTFAAGSDIEELGRSLHDPAVSERAGDVTYRSQMRLRRAAKPPIAKIRGACVGGGCGIALCCDLRFADTSAQFGITPGKLGLIYSVADTKRLVDVVGQARAKDILYTGRIFGAAEALDYGLIDWLVEPKELDKAVADYTGQICDASQVSARANKEIIHAILDGLADDTPRTRRLFVDGFKGADFKEGQTAFMEKRKPKFKSS